MRRFWHWGQLGDICYSLPTVAALGGGSFATSIRGPRFAFIAPLLEAQPYIRGVRSDPKGRMDDWSYQPRGTTHDLNAFRLDVWLANIAREHLARSHARPHGVAIDPTRPWLVPDPSWGPRGSLPRTIVARSFRYRHPQGRPRYDSIIKPDSWFVGLPDEAHDFGMRHLPVADAWDLARVIWQAGSFAGNQSFPLSVAVGLGVPHHIETEPNCSNCLLEGCEWQTRLC